MAMEASFSHVSLVVPDLAQAVTRMQALFGLTPGEVAVNEAQGVRLVFFELGSARIEMMEPLPGNKSLRAFLDKHPAGGVHHFALSVPSLASAREALALQGIKLLGQPQDTNVHGAPIAFIHPRDFFGALVELEQHD